MASIALLNIGNELLNGRTLNTNAAWLGNFLRENGYHLIEIRVIPDDEPTIIRSVEELLSKHSIVFITGGLGPTNDDITKLALMKLFGGELVEHAVTSARLAEWYRKRGRDMNEPMRMQAYLPSTCEMLQNAIGTAPGMLFRRDKKLAISLPGIPAEMKNLVTEQAIHVISKEFPAEKIRTKIIRLYGKPESEVASEMESIKNELPEKISIAWLPGYGDLKIVLSGKEAEVSEADLFKSADRIAGLFGKHIYSRENFSLEETLGQLLKANSLTISCAESCTGGALGAAITSVSGSSTYFMVSLVTYSKASKQKILGVSTDTIAQFTVVSEEVALEMAKKTRELMGTDIAVSVTGTAEIHPGDPVYGKPEIWIGISYRNQLIANKMDIWQDRHSNIQRAVNTALFMAIRAIST